MSYFISIPLYIAKTSKVAYWDLETLLEQHFQPSLVHDYQCHRCGARDRILHLRNMIKTLKHGNNYDSTQFPGLIRTARCMALEQELEIFKCWEITHPMDSRFTFLYDLPVCQNLAKITTQIIRLPKVLSLHIVRSGLSQFGAIIKRLDPVDFPAHLDLSTMQFGGSASQSMRYNLKSIIVHCGSHQTGHYVCFRLLKTHWIRISDESVHQVSWNAVKSESSNVHMLFYEKADPGEQ